MYLFNIDHWNNLHYPLHSSLQDGYIHDIWNGEAIKPLKDSFFNCPEHLGLTLSTDGVPVFKSSQESLWPVYLVVNNLPPGIRMNKENTILCGIWFGPKPAMKSLLQPVVDMLESLHAIGISMKIYGDVKTIHAVLLNGIFDLVAKALVVNMVQFNGQHGCLTCTHPGSTHIRGRRVYHPNTQAELRTHASILDAAQQAERLGVVVHSIKGTSVLAKTIDLVDGIPIDYMHAVLEGVTRRLLHAWFDSENHREPFYLGRYLNQIDKKFLKQTPPSEFSRIPRSIKKHLRYWKASELRSWLLFYSLPLLLDFMPSLYLHHFSLLVSAMHILLMDCISTSQVNAAELMLEDFVTLLPELYGEKSCTMNAHLLCHLTKYVRLWGPLWTHSAFGFESYNGHLKYLFHSRSNILDQLVFNLDIQQTLQLLYPRMADMESYETLKFLETLGGKVLTRNMNKIAEHSYILGKTLKKYITIEDSRVLGIVCGHIEIFTRLYHHGTIYHSHSYNKGGSKRNNQVCCFNIDGQKFGHLQYFTLNPQPAAIIKIFEPTGDTLLGRAGHSCRPAS